MQLGDSLQSHAFPEPELRLCVLLVDPEPAALDSRRGLLVRHQIPVYTARNAIEVFGAEPLIEPGLVVLNQRLGPVDLEAAAEYTRHRWPQARLLIMGEGEPPLEDHLYDETAADGCNRAEFLQAVDRCARMWRIQHR
jgi:hypothetical protein